MDAIVDFLDLEERLMESIDVAKLTIFAMAMQIASFIQV